MSLGLARALLGVLAVYLAFGVAFALPFVLTWVDRIDPAARRGSWGFRLLILPGSVALWPVLLARLRRGSPPPEERNPHRDRARAAAGRGESP